MFSCLARYTVVSLKTQCSALDKCFQARVVHTTFFWLLLIILRVCLFSAAGWPFPACSLHLLYCIHFPCYTMSYIYFINFIFEFQESRSDMRAHHHPGWRSFIWAGCKHFISFHFNKHRENKHKLHCPGIVYSSFFAMYRSTHTPRPCTL